MCLGVGFGAKGRVCRRRSRLIFSSSSCVSSRGRVSSGRGGRLRLALPAMPTRRLCWRSSHADLANAAAVCTCWGSPVSRLWTSACKVNSIFFWGVACAKSNACRRGGGVAGTPINLGRLFSVAFRWSRGALTNFTRRSPSWLDACMPMSFKTSAQRGSADSSSALSSASTDISAAGGPSAFAAPAFQSATCCWSSAKLAIISSIEISVLPVRRGPGEINFK